MKARFLAAGDRALVIGDAPEGFVMSPTGKLAVAMLLPGFGAEHMRRMKQITHFACIEVAVRDTNPGHIRLGKHGEAVVESWTVMHDREGRPENGLSVIRVAPVSINPLGFLPVLTKSTT